MNATLVFGQRINFEEFNDVAAQALAELESKAFEARDKLEVLAARASWEELAYPVMVLRGLLRTIPSKNRQRDIEIFEGHFGIRGEKPQSLESISKRWKLTVKGTEKIIGSLWLKLQIIKSSIITPLELRNTLKRIEEVEKNIGDIRPLHFSTSLPDQERVKEIIELINSMEVKQKSIGDLTSYNYGQLELNFEPLVGGNARETVTMNVCRAFGISLKEIGTKCRGGNANTRLVRARFVIVHVLCDHLGENPGVFEQTGFMSRATVHHACLTIRQELRDIRSPSAPAIRNVKQKCFAALRKAGQFEVALTA